MSILFYIYITLSTHNLSSSVSERTIEEFEGWSLKKKKKSGIKKVKTKKNYNKREQPGFNSGLWARKSVSGRHLDLLNF